MPQNTSPFVWTDTRGSGRMRYAQFRREVLIDGTPRSAQFSLFVDAHYHLIINGRFVAFGPVRFYPEFPCYDTHDITKYLVPGRNVLCVLALCPGVSNYHALINQAGFTAWGAIETSEGASIDLGVPGAWICRDAPGYSRDTQKFSFAQAPVYERDVRLGNDGWLATDFVPDASWKSPVPLGNQEAWGGLRPRPLPPLDYETLSPARLLQARHHKNEFDTYATRLSDHRYSDRHVMPRLHGILSAWVHSPTDQTVMSRGYWGEFWCNGHSIDSDYADDRQVCKIRCLNLKAGWNFLVAEYMLVNDVWDFSIAFPKEAQLRLAADPTEEALAKPGFHFSGFVDEVEGPKRVDFTQVEATAAVARTWPLVPARREHTLSQRSLAWADFGEQLNIPEGSAPELGKDETVSFIYDMGTEVLGRIQIEYEASEGCIIDVGTAQDLKDDRPHYNKALLVLSGDRQFTASGPGRMETFFPRGSRFFQIAVTRNTGFFRLKSFRIGTQAYPHKLVGSFRCSDPVFNKLWEAGWRTLRLCSEDVYTDTSWRERTLYGGDALPEFATAAVTSGDTALIERCIEIFIESTSDDNGWQQSMAPMERTRAPLYEYPILCFLTLEWVSRLKNDRALAQRGYSTYKGLLERTLQERTEDGLFRSFAPPFIDHCLSFRSGLAGPLQAVMAEAFRALARLSKLLGKADEADRWEKIADETEAALKKVFWNPETGGFHLAKDDEQSPDAFHPIAGYWPEFFGCASGEQATSQAKLYEKAFSTETSPEEETFGSPYSCFFFLGALYRHGNVDLAERFIRRNWGYMLEDGFDTIWEHFDPNKSMTHAWSTAPNFYLSTRALGVRLGMPEKDPLNIILIAPESESLDWAEGVVPHPLGPVGVRWSLEDNHLNISVTPPPGAEVCVEPRGRLATFTRSVSIEEPATS